MRYYVYITFLHELLEVSVLVDTDGLRPFALIMFLYVLDAGSSFIKVHILQRIIILLILEVSILRNDQDGLVLIMLERYNLFGHSSLSSVDVQSRLNFFADLMEQEVYIGKVMLFNLVNGRYFYLLKSSHLAKFLPHLMETFKVKNAVMEGLHDVITLQDINCGGIFCDGFEIGIPVEN